MFMGSGGYPVMGGLYVINSDSSVMNNSPDMYNNGTENNRLLCSNMDGMHM